MWKWAKWVASPRLSPTIILSASVIVLSAHLVLSLAGSMAPLQIFLETCLSILFSNSHQIAAVLMQAVYLFLVLLVALYVVQMVGSIIKRNYVIIAIQAISIILCFFEFYFGYGYVVKRNIEKSKALVQDFLLNPKSYDAAYDDASILSEIESSHFGRGSAHLVFSFPMMGMYDFRIDAHPSTQFIVQLTWRGNKPTFFAHRQKFTTEKAP
jgi:hypothetical protein